MGEPFDFSKVTRGLDAEDSQEGAEEGAQEWNECSFVFYYFGNIKVRFIFSFVVFEYVNHFNSFFADM